MRYGFRWMAGLAVLVVSAAVGAIAYNAGVAHGLALSTGAAGDAARNAVAYYPYRPWGFGFFPFGVLVFWFLAARLFFRGGGWRGGWQYPGPGGRAATFDDWHRRAHERMNSQPPA
jgi:hypothetical protein